MTVGWSMDLRDVSPEVLAIITGRCQWCHRYHPVPVPVKAAHRRRYQRRR